jgi:DNA-binding transcriptional LysR family regulator
MLDYSREFIVLASHLNFTSAAKQLNISQPGLSRHITELERHIGFELVNRSPVTLTPAGRYYLEQVSPLIETYQRVLADGRELARKAREKVIIWRPPLEGRGSQIIYEAVARAHTLGPHLEFEFRHDRKYSVLEAIASGRADAGIIYTEDGDVPENTVCEPLLTEPFYVLMRKNNLLALRGKFTFEDTSDCYLVFSTNKRYEDWNRGVLGIYHRAGIEPRFRMKDFDDLSGYFATFQTDEISLVSPVMAFLSQVNPHFVALMPEAVDPPCSSTILVRRKGGHDSGIEFFAYLCEEIALDIIKNGYAPQLRPGGGGGRSIRSA